MGIIRRQSIKTSLAFVLGFIVGHVHVLWILPLCLSSDQVGLVRVLVSAGSLMGAFMPFGAHAMIIRYFPFFRDREKGHYGFFLFALLIPLVGAALVLLLVFLFQGRIQAAYQDSPQVLEYFHYAVFLALIINYQKVFMAYSRALLRAVVPNLLRQVVVRTLTILAVLFYFFSFYDLQGLLNGYLLAYGSTVLILIFYIGSFGELQLAPSDLRIPWKKVGEMTRYGAFVMTTSAGNLFSRNIDTLMLGALAGLSNTGVYAISYFIGSLIELPKRALTQISGPMLAKAWKKGDKEEIQKIYQKSSTNNFLVGGFLFLCVWTNIEELFTIIPNGEIYEKGMTVVLLIAAARSIDLLTGLTGQVLVNSSHYRVNLVGMIILVGTLVVLNYSLIPLMGMEGAALSTLIAVFLSEALKVTYLWRKEKLFPFSVQTIKTLLVLAGIYLLISLIPMIHDPWTTIFLRSIGITILLGLVVYFLRISEDANELIDEKIRELRA